MIVLRTGQYCLCICCMEQRSSFLLKAMWVAHLLGFSLLWTCTSVVCILYFLKSSSRACVITNLISRSFFFLKIDMQIFNLCCLHIGSVCILFKQHCILKCHRNTSSCEAVYYYVGGWTVEWLLVSYFCHYLTASKSSLHDMRCLVYLVCAPYGILVFLLHW